MTKRIKDKDFFEYTGRDGIQKVQRELNAIWREHARRLEGRPKDADYSHTKNESAKYFVMREIYALGRQLIKEKPRFDPEDLVNMRRLRPTTRPEVLPGPFYALFMAVYKEDHQVSARERWLMARELKYAHRHNIPPELLCGFLLQSGTRKDVNKKLKNEYTEPAFRHLLGE